MKTKERTVKGAEVSRSTMILSMRNLLRSPEYQMSLAVQGVEREKIIEDGKKTNNAEAWARLDGFDRASKTIMEWANKQLPEELPNYREEDNGEQE